jgi:hypothetical protein
MRQPRRLIVGDQGVYDLVQRFAIHDFIDFVER